MHKYSIILALSASIMSSTSIAKESRNVELLAASCAACHGTRGHSVGGLPSLAGMDRLHIIEQMKQFINGERPATVMMHHASGYSQDEIEMLAQFFSEQ